MTNVLIVHGAGGHGRVVSDAARLLGWDVMETDVKWRTAPGIDDLCHVAIGDNETRSNYKNYNLQTIIHPTAYVDSSAEIQAGVFVGPRGVIHISAKVGRGAIVNTGAIVEHDCVVGDWVHLSPGCVLCGTVTIGEGAWIGANATVRDGISIAPWAVVGCGAVVTKDIVESGTYVGAPARRIK
uniref:Putative acetyltransferase n=1 Tax=viral metagenome TaxID=1070528 RepID=A0A6M3ITP7_9ZZZZ